MSQITIKDALLEHRNKFRHQVALTTYRSIAERILSEKDHFVAHNAISFKDSYNLLEFDTNDRDYFANDLFHSVAELLKKQGIVMKHMDRFNDRLTFSIL